MIKVLNLFIFLHFTSLIFTLHLGVLGVRLRGHDRLARLRGGPVPGGIPRRLPPGGEQGRKAAASRATERPTSFRRHVGKFDFPGSGGVSTRFYDKMQKRLNTEPQGDPEALEGMAR